MPVGAPTSYLLTCFLQILHRTRHANTVFARTETPGCRTLGKRVENEKLSAVSPLDPLLWTWSWTRLCQDQKWSVIIKSPWLKWSKSQSWNLGLWDWNTQDLENFLTWIWQLLSQWQVFVPGRIWGRSRRWWVHSQTLYSRNPPPCLWPTLWMSIRILREECFCWWSCPAESWPARGQASPASPRCSPQPGILTTRECEHQTRAQCWRCTCRGGSRRMRCSLPPRCSLWGRMSTSPVLPTEALSTSPPTQEWRCQQSPAIHVNF